MTFLEIFITNHQVLVYFLIFFAMLFDAELFFLTAAIFAGQGHLDWRILVLVSFLSVFLGDVAFYFLGKISKESSFGMRVKNRFQKFHLWLDDNFMPRYSKVVFFSKFIYYINRFMPVLAAWHGMRFKKFLKIHLYADIVWIIIITIIGFGLNSILYLVGPRWVIERLGLFFSLLIVVFILGEYLLRKFFFKKISNKEKSSNS